MPSGVKKKSARRKKKDKQRKANNRRILAGHHHNPPRKKIVQYEPPPVQHNDEDSSSSSSEESSSSSSSSSSLHRPLPKQVIPHSSFSRKNSVTWSDLSGPESKQSLGTGSTPMSNHTKGSSQGPQTSGYPRAKEILKRPSYGLGKRPSVVIEKGESQLEVNEDDLENHDDGNSSSSSDESSDSSGSEYTSSSDSSQEEEMKFTYPMWHRHHIMVETALSSHQNEKVEIMKTGMKRLQKVHDKTETHPIIAKLLIAKLTYEGFEFDKRFAMDLYLKLEDKAAKEFIMDMVKKQKTLKTKQELEKKKKLEMKRKLQTRQKQQLNQVSEEDSSSSEDESGSEDDSSSSSSSDSSDGEEKKMEEPIPKKATLIQPSEPIPAQTIPPYNNPDGVPSYITSGDDTTYSSVGASVGGSNPFKHMPTSTQQHTIPVANPIGGIFDNVGLDSMQWKTSKQTLSTQKSQPNSELLKVDMDVSVSSESPRDVMRRIETQWTKNYRPSRRRSVDVVSKESARERMRRLEQKYHKNSSM